MFGMFVSGSIAGSAAVFFTYPFDVIRTRLAYQTTKKVYNGMLHAMYVMVFKEKTTAMLRGISPTLFGMGIYGGTSFSIFFSLKNSLKDPSNLEIFAFGAIGGLVGQILSYPFDVVRKRMLALGFIEKVSDFKSGYDGDHKSYKMRNVFIMIWKQEGYRGLLKGLSLNFIKAPIMLGTVHLSNFVINKKLTKDLI